MRTDPYGWRDEDIDPGFYLTNWLGVKLATLVVLAVIYLCVRYQLTVHAEPFEVDFAWAHAKSKVLLALWFDPDAKLVFHTEHGTYDLYRSTCAHAQLFIECWQKVLGLIVRGLVAAVLVIASPPFVVRFIILVHDVWEDYRIAKLSAPRGLPEAPAVQHPAVKEQAAAATPVLQPASIPAQPRPQSPPDPMSNDDVLPAPVVQPRPVTRAKPARKQDAPAKPKTPSSLQPGQVRKRRKPKA